MSDDIVGRAKAALEGVSEQPWEAQEYDCFPGDEGVSITAGIGMEQRGIAYTGMGYSWSTERQAEADAEFIVAARSLVPDLVAEIERLRMAEVERMRVNP